MITISQDKLKIIKKLKNSSDIYKVLEEEIKEAILNKTKMPLIKIAIEEAIGKELSLQSLKNFVAQNKKRWIEENKKTQLNTLNTKKGEKMEKKFILFANDKGGVGKTTLATLLNLPNSLIINLDRSREISHIFPYKNIIDFDIYQKQENIDLEDYLYLIANEDNNFEYIILDTKGGITDDLVKVLPYVDSIIIPIKIGSLSEEPSYNFIMELKSALETFNNKQVNWGIVYNEISPKFLKKVDIAKYELLDEFKKTEDTLNELLEDKLKALTYFKKSEAIITRENEKKDIDELIKLNPAAYLPIKKEIDRLNKDLEKVIKG